MNGEMGRFDASAVILAGGKSSRMGQPKALLLFDDEPLIIHIVRALEGLFGDTVVVAAPGEQFVELSSLLRSQPNEPNKPNEPKVTLVRDEVAYQGPVGGIYYGLRAAGREISFVTSCDVPFLNLSLISYLRSQISNHDVVVPYWQGRFQPLHAVYRQSVVSLLKEQLERGEFRPISLYKKVRTREVHEDEIRRFDPEGLSFLNMNTPEDYQEALKRWQDLHRPATTGLQAGFVQHQNRPFDFAEELTGGGAEVCSSTPAPRHPCTNGPFTCTVELFGVARLRAKTAELSLELPQGATLAHLFLALAERLPTLVGPVIAPDKSSLASGHACNINGRDFVRSPSAKVNPGDRIFIISADAGG